MGSLDSPRTIVLITGSNRGIGIGLLERYLAKPSHIVIAAVRDPTHPTAQALHKLPIGINTQLIVVKLDANVEQDAHDAVAELQQKHGIEHLDIVIANAGVAYTYPTVADVKIDDIKAHMRPNVYGVIALYQATRALLLKKSTTGNTRSEPIFFIMGSSAGLLTNHLPIPNGAYAVTKTALNWYTRRINAEDEWLNCLSIDPGHVSTDLGDAAAKAVGIGDHAPTSVRESCDGMMEILGKATKKEYGGRLAIWSGGFHEW